MLELIKNKALELLANEKFDSLAIGLIDLKEMSYEAWEVHDSPVEKNHYFDLASVTKVLVLGSTYLAHPEWFDENLKLLLCHQGGLPSWGRLSTSDWKQTLKQFPIQKSPAVYSDYSPLRLMLELEERHKIKLSDVIREWLDTEVRFWKDLPANVTCPVTGERNGKPISGVVHDPNAYNLNQFCAHAGLFGTIDGVCRTVLNLQEKYKLTEAIKREYETNKNLDRFILGWDRAQDLEKTLAGKGCSDKTFGHLGFTGTSLWIDLEKMKGIVILSNATKYYWYDKEGINNIRRTLGNLYWQNIR